MQRIIHDTGPESKFINYDISIWNIELLGTNLSAFVWNDDKQIKKKLTDLDLRFPQRDVALMCALNRLYQPWHELSIDERGKNMQNASWMQLTKFPFL